ncbi:SEC-C metal-binding domain-containing protein, partial [Aggregatibacter actinomycetemcomitans]
IYLLYSLGQVDIWLKFVLERSTAPNRIASFSQTEKPKRKVGRNDPCPCGSGKKYKKCCINK